MPTSDLLSYIGAISGVIGATTGIAGAWVAYVAYRKTEKLKALDLRLELRKAIASLQHDLEKLPELLDRAGKSRVAISAATGRLQSGATKHWQTQLDADAKSIETLATALANLCVDYSATPPSELESKLVEATTLQLNADQIREAYVAALTEDDRQRDHLRADQRVVTQARLEGKA